MRRFIALAVLALFFPGCAGQPVKKKVEVLIEEPPPARLAALPSSESLLSPEPPAEPPSVAAAQEEPGSAAGVPPARPPGVSRPAVPAAGTPPAGEAEKYVSLNFDNADITVVIQTIAELINLNYILAPGVRGRVTIQTSDKLPVSSLFIVLEEILEVNSLTAIQAGDFFKIVPTNQARQKEIETLVDEGEGLPPGSRIVTKVVPLAFTTPSEVVKILNPLKSPAGLYLAHNATRLLFLTDNAKKINELLKIVRMLDVDTFSRIQVELYPVKFAAVDQLAKDLTQVVSMVFSAAGRGRSLFKIIPVANANSLMIISGEPGLAENIQAWIAKLDQPATGTKERIFVYSLAHADAESIATVLKSIFESEGSSKQTSTPAATPAAEARPTTPTRTRSPTPARRPTPTIQRTVVSAAAGESTVKIVADKDTNSLIIQTAPWFYPVVEETIQKLDVMPKQVLIEVLIAEITLDDENQFGLQWSLRGQGSAKAFGENHAFSTLGQNVFPPEGLTGVTVPGAGFSFLVTEANRLTAVLNAYAKASKLNILSSPHILAMNNKEAKIDVGAEVPILRTRTTEAAGSTTDTTSNTVTNDIEYRSTGVILTVTPHINEGRYVTLDIQQEVSEAQTNTLGGTDSPIIRKRTAQTTMVVKDNQSLVIGGLIEENRDKSREGLPWLHRIPILGYLFGTTKETLTKTELVMLITPRVIISAEEGQQVTRSVQDRLMTLKKGVETFQRERATSDEGDTP